MFCKPVVCDDCDHEFDARKPRANLATRKRNLAIIINGVGLLGIILVVGCLGLLIANGYTYLLAGHYWISVFPGLALLLTIVAINLVGDRLRDVLNPRLQ